MNYFLLRVSKGSVLYCSFLFIMFYSETRAQKMAACGKLMAMFSEGMRNGELGVVGEDENKKVPPFGEKQQEQPQPAAPHQQQQLQQPRQQPAQQQQQQQQPAQQQPAQQQLHLQQQQQQPQQLQIQQQLPQQQQQQPMPRQLMQVVHPVRQHQQAPIQTVTSVPSQPVVPVQSVPSQQVVRMVPVMMQNNVMLQQPQQQQPQPQQQQPQPASHLPPSTQHISQAAAAAAAASATQTSPSQGVRDFINEVCVVIASNDERCEQSLNLITSDCVNVEVPTISQEALDFAGTWCGKPGLFEFLRRLRMTCKFNKFAVEDFAANGSVAFANVKFEIVFHKNKRMYKAQDPLVLTFKGGLISKIAFYFAGPAMLKVAAMEQEEEKKLLIPQLNVPIIPCPPTMSQMTAMASSCSQPMGASIPLTKTTSSLSVGSAGSSVRANQQQRLVPQEAPCGHNSWDNVRIKKGEITFRCRECQAQWRTEVANTTRCNDFQSGNCSRGTACHDLHVHAHKQSLSQRLNQFGGTVLERVPFHQWSNGQGGGEVVQAVRTLTSHSF